MSEERKVHIEIHYGFPVIVEDKPIAIARIPITGDQPHQCIYLHPRYVPRGVDHERIEVRGHRKGRTLDILLDEQFVHCGDSYGIMSIKGGGADADEELVIHPKKWWKEKEGSSRWISRTRGEADPYMRLWGAVQRKSGEKEYASDIFSSSGIPETPYIALNPIPPEISRYIGAQRGFPFDLKIVQLARLANTNIRLNMVPSIVEQERESYLNPETLADADVAAIMAQLRLVQQGRMIARIPGIVADNRYIDGVFTDRENYYSTPIDAQSDDEDIVTALITDFVASGALSGESPTPSDFLMGVITSTEYYNLKVSTDFSMRYKAQLEKWLGLPFAQYPLVATPMFVCCLLTEYRNGSPDPVSSAREKMMANHIQPCLDVGMSFAYHSRAA